MTDPEIQALEKLCEEAPEFRAYVTSRGGVVLINGPFPLPQARAAAEFTEAAREAMPKLIAEVKAMRSKVAELGLCPLFGQDCSKCKVESQ